MLAAFRWNLRVLSYIALVVGAFLIYNTISISVVRRRNEIGVVRALGGTRGMVLSGFVAEAGVFALAGSLLGLAIGRVMAIGAVKLIGNTVGALYVSSRPAPVELMAGIALTGVALGVCVSLAAACSGSGGLACDAGRGDGARPRRVDSKFAVTLQGRAGCGHVCGCCGAVADCLRCIGSRSSRTELSYC